MKRVEQLKIKIRKLEQKLKDYKSNAETWKYYYKDSQTENHRLHKIIRKLEKLEGEK